jgi:feruloyl esterase
MANNLFAAPGATFGRADLRLATAAAVDACDAHDGLKDGVIIDPRTCRWNPAALQCSGPKTATCLAAPQVAALQAAYRGIRSPDGQWAMWPISRGGESTWGAFVNTSGTPEPAARGLAPLKELLLPVREVDWSRFSAVTDAPQVRRSAFAHMYDAGDPDLSAFFVHGGKLLMWGGESDVGPTPTGLIDYALAVAGANPQAERQFRLFLVPGVGHCGGAFGNELLDLNEIADVWADSGQAPDIVIANIRERSLKRPVCAWPKVARYGGSGDPEAAGSWRCTSGVK